jgi:hypothetical protein
LFIVLSGCRKKEVSVRVVGTVKNSVLNQGVSNAEVKLYVKEIQGGSFSNSFKVLHTTTTDANGYYAFEFPHHTVIEYKLQVENDLYFEYSQIINPDDWSLTALNTQDIDLLPKSVIRLRVKNLSPQTPIDNVVVVPDNVNCSQCFNPGLLSLNGTQVDSLFVGTTLGMIYWKYTYVVTKNSITYNYKDSVYCSAGDTASVTIFY